MHIIVDDLNSQAVKELLQAHHDDMLKHSPPESVHALDLSALKSADVTFWSVWVNDELAGCGALKQLNATHAELKSMRTSAYFLRQGVAAKLLTHIITYAQAQAIEQISLETGTMAVFSPAQKLYKRFGFQECAPFANYQLDAHSMFLTKVI